jgi:hypothetical protein
LRSIKSQKAERGVQKVQLLSVTEKIEWSTGPFMERKGFFPVIKASL